MTSWQATVTLIGKMDDDSAFTLLEELGRFGAAVSVERDFSGGTITLSVEADTTLNAASEAAQTVSDAIEGPITIIGLEVITESEADKRLREPLFPEVVSFAEIGQMAGVSRQRARQFSDNPAFPTPVITTGQGPLYSRHSVERWLETRNTRPGRPAMATV
ncbi:hypothetical protein PU630_07645 [Microbacterium horticulturae]|uniref:DNA-binding protein n=1 Tax=Microbacterium horticulturae TaxID=3028316 RepID=A0ABY8C5D1_9MICO|nr:hypothetical protein [Microbacterium sp. KACC 23027]WEG10410.1 hypothetical protein PU630_07645 [Microbacterium sp. KACC 23027]